MMRLGTAVRVGKWFAGVVVMGVQLTCHAAPLQDVHEHLARREVCDRWRSGDDFVVMHRVEFERASCRACLRSDGELAALKKKYRAKPEIVGVLQMVDEQPEPIGSDVLRRPCR